LTKQELHGEGFYYKVGYRLRREGVNMSYAIVSNPNASNLTIHDQKDAFQQYEITVQSINNMGSAKIDDEDRRIGYSGEGSKFYAVSMHSHQLQLLARDAFIGLIILRMHFCTVYRHQDRVADWLLSDVLTQYCQWYSDKLQILFRRTVFFMLCVFVFFVRRQRLRFEFNLSSLSILGQIRVSFLFCFV
jgi:hypothetical protein